MILFFRLFLILLAASSALNAGELPVSANYRTNLAAYWKCNENAGVPRSQVGGSFAETFSGGAYLINSGKFGGAIFMDGVTDNMTTDGPTQNDEFTVSFLINTAVIPAVQGQVWQALSNGRWDVSLNTNGTLTFAPNTVNSRNYVVSTMTLTANRWYHVVTSYSALNTRSRLYINGSLVRGASGFNTGGMASDGGSPGFYIGGFASLFSGKFDEIAIWKRELTKGEVEGLYAIYENRNMINHGWQ